MTLHENAAEKLLGVLATAFGILLIVLIIPTQINIVGKAPWYNQPRFFPYVVSGIFILMGVLLFLSGVKKSKRPTTEGEETYEFSAQGTKMVLLTLGIIIFYVAGLSFLPYIPCTIVALGVLMWFFGQRNLKIGALVAIALPVIIYLSFTYLLKLRLP